MKDDLSPSEQRPRRWLWRVLAICLIVGGIVGLGVWSVSWLGGAFTHAPSDLKTGLSADGQALIKKAFDGMDSSLLLDYHTHIVGTGAGGTGAFIHPNLTTWLHPYERLRFEVYKSASAIDDIEQADSQYVSRLLDLIRNIEGHGRYHIFAFDKHHLPNGDPDLDKTPFYVPNDYVLSLAKEHPDVFVPVVSIHPYRQDALAELERTAGAGARFVKWLPNAMGIDPADSQCDPFYERMRQLDMVLLSHAGDEFAVAADGGQDLGNPLRLRKALDHGVKVIVAHCASLGEGDDLDHPEGERVNNFELFLRLMEEPRYEGLVFGEISAILQANRLPNPLKTLLERKDLHSRLVNGSDYPLPAVNVVLRTWDLVAAGFLTEEEREALNEIYDYNPLLFDFVVKRIIRHPETGQRFADSVFHAHPALSPEGDSTESDVEGDVKRDH